jgi:deazaflavin-dependent oxidoreductase (nitroreductase family)
VVDVANLDNPVDPTGDDWRAEHIERYLATDGEDGYWWRPGVPTLLLTTVGRRSGRAYRTPLIFGRDGDRLVVVASKGGDPAHPDWYRNLQDEPHVRVQVRGDVFDARARTASPDERPALWPAMAKIWPAYDEYQAKTERQIPLVVLHPMPTEDPGRSS